MTSFDDFVRDRGPALMRFASAVTADPMSAEDVVQTVLLRVLRDWDRVAAMARPDAYVRRAIVNEYLSWRRKWSRIVPHPVVPDRADPTDFADRYARRSELATRIAVLPARQRAALVMRYFEDLSDREIAEALGCRAVTVRGYISRALRSLRVEMSETAGPSERSDHVQRN